MRLQHILYSGIIATAFAVISVLAYQNSDPGVAQRIAVALGGNLANGGYIQHFTVWLFAWGMLEVRAVLRKVRFERTLFNFPILPSDEHVILGEKEVNTVRVKIMEFLDGKRHDGHSYYLLNMIKSICTKFRANRSIPESMEIVNMQSRVNQSKTESEQSIIRYIAWAIPSVGFVGTVLGIAQALEKANEPIEVVTATLGLAFDTTLLALLFSLVFMWRIHEMQEANELLHIGNEEYVVKNLVNKIDVS